MIITDSRLLAIKHEINQRIDDIKDHMASGRCVDYADYKRNAGAIAGLEVAKDIVNAVARNMSDDEDEALDDF